MSRKNKIYGAVLTLMFILLVVLQHYAAQKTNWELDLRGSGKMPYGGYIVRNMLTYIFPAKSISENDESLFISLKNTRDLPGNTIILTDRFFTDTYDLEVLLDYVSTGNSVFISAFGFDDKLQDTLGFEVFSPLFDTILPAKGAEYLKLYRTGVIGNSEYKFAHKLTQSYFSEYDTLSSDRLGSDRKGNTNFIGTRFGKGNFYIHTQPLAFTNYHILYGNKHYAAAALSHLSVNSVLWDQYYKPGKVINTSPLRYILSEPALRAAYYAILLSILIYMFTVGRRRQRRIPIILPLQNSSVQFIQTVGRLYYKSANHTNIARKKTIYFKEFMRENYFIQNFSNSTPVINSISEKTGVSPELVKRLALSIEQIDKGLKINENELVKFHTDMEEFYRKCS